jgi:hypothetical protein
MKVNMTIPGSPSAPGGGAPSPGNKGGGLHWGTILFSVGFSVLIVSLINLGRNRQIELLVKRSLKKEEEEEEEEVAPNQRPTVNKDEK